MINDKPAREPVPEDTSTMRFGIFYEHQLPRPWTEGLEHKLFQDALDQVELADHLGIDYAWEVEHHFLEEYSHSSAPEIFLAACSQRTKNIRLGHGICLMPPKYNHPARVAERIATLDLVSNGRVEWGTGESATAVEMGGFGVDPDDKRSMWEEATREAANMLTVRPYPGFCGRWFDMPCRNIVPKPVQRPHPPMWVACSRRETIHRAARAGIGALAFAFVKPEQAAQWVEDYYRKRANLLTKCGYDAEQCFVFPEWQHYQRARVSDLVEASSFWREFPMPVVRRYIGEVREPPVAHWLCHRIVLARL